MKVNPIITLLLVSYYGLLLTTLCLVTTNQTTLCLVTTNQTTLCLVTRNQTALCLVTTNQTTPCLVTTNQTTLSLVTNTAVLPFLLYLWKYYESVYSLNWSVCSILTTKYLLLAECKVRTASYGPSFFLPFMAQARSARVIKIRKEKIRIHNLPYGSSKQG